MLPDPTCTPGASDAAVSQANIGQTICKDGWTSTVRPPESYTEPLKYQQMAAYGDAGVGEELRGGSSDPARTRRITDESREFRGRNRGASPNPKDSVENAANRAVCDGRMPLAAARQEISSNWIAFGQQLGVVSKTLAE